MGFEDEEQVRAKLREKFPPGLIGKLPRTQKRPELDYVGHAAVTDRLNNSAPGWSFHVLEMFSYENECWVHGGLTIDGITREEYGKGSNPQSAIGNCLRRAAMRYGVAIDMWGKEELVEAGAVGEDAPATTTTGADGGPSSVPSPGPGAEGKSPSEEANPLAPGSPPSDGWDELKRRAGSASKARERLNEVNGADYNPRSAPSATAEELALALASFDDADYA